MGAAVALLVGLLYPSPGYADLPVDTETDPAALDSLSAMAGLAVDGGGSPGLKLELGPGFAFIAPPVPEVDLDVRVPIGVGFVDQSYSDGTVSFSVQSLFVDAVVMIDASFAINHDIQAFVGGGIGIGWSYLMYDVAFLGPQADWAFAFLVRFRAGIRFRVAEQLFIEAQPFALTVNVNESAGVVFAFLVGLHYEL
jgi:hypothetical protein